MMRTLLTIIIIVSVAAMSLQPAAAAQRDNDDFSKPPEDAGKPLPRKATVDPGSIEERSRIGGSSILNKAKHDRDAKAVAPDERRKRMLSMFGKKPVRFAATARTAKDLPVLKSAVAANTTESAPADTGSGALALKIIGATLCLALVGLLAVMVLGKRRGKPAKKPVLVPLPGQPIDLTGYMQSLGSFEQQIKFNRRRDKGR